MRTSRVLNFNYFFSCVVLLFMLAFLGACGGGDTDTSAPNTTILSGPDNLTNLTNATFSFTSTEAGSTFQCSIDDGVYAGCISPESYSNLPDGSHVFNVRATDVAGNTDASPAVYNWVIDTTNLSQDLQGTWNVHMLTAGDSPNWTGWFNGKLTIDAAGLGTWSTVNRSDGGLTPSSAGTFLISATGVVTNNAVASFYGNMSGDKNTIIATLDDGGGGYDLVVYQKQSATYTKEDLEGSWNFHMLTSGDSKSWTGWANGNLTVDASSVVTWLSITRSDGNTALPGKDTVSISSSGVVTSAGIASFHGNMSSDKNTIVATLSDAGGGYDLIVYQKQSGTYTSTDLSGNWAYMGLISGESPNERPGWYYGAWTIDDSGTMTTTTPVTDSMGNNTWLPKVESAISISTSGIITLNSDPGIKLHGMMNFNKNIIAFTSTMCPGSSGAVCGYNLGLWVRK